jgi:hypothetical protein
VDRNLASVKKPIQTNKDKQFLLQQTDIQPLWRNQYRPRNQTFSYSGQTYSRQTFNLYGETSIDPEIRHSLTVDRHSASMEKPVQSYEVRQFLSQWTDIQLLSRNQYWPTKSDSFSHIGQRFSFHVRTSTEPQNQTFFSHSGQTSTFHAKIILNPQSETVSFTVGIQPL